VVLGGQCGQPGRRFCLERRTETISPGVPGRRCGHAGLVHGAFEDWMFAVGITFVSSLGALHSFWSISRRAQAAVYATDGPSASPIRSSKTAPAASFRNAHLLECPPATTASGLTICANVLPHLEQRATPALRAANPFVQAEFNALRNVAF